MGIYLAEVGQSDQIHNPPIPTEGRDARDTVAFLNAPRPWLWTRGEEGRRARSMTPHDSCHDHFVLFARSGVIL
jgi:hypothetical protein